MTQTCTTRRSPERTGGCSSANDALRPAAGSPGFRQPRLADAGPGVRPSISSISRASEGRAMPALPSDPFESGIVPFAMDLRGGRITALEATDACLARIAALNHRLQAFQVVDADRARQAARAVDEQIGRTHGRTPVP